jgi:hypothetical protein
MPGEVADIFIYQSGKNIRITITSKMIGNEKINAIGKPLLSLLTKLLCFSLFASQ